MLAVVKEVVEPVRERGERGDSMRRLSVLSSRWKTEKGRKGVALNDC